MFDNPVPASVFETDRPILAEAALRLLRRAGIEATIQICDGEAHLPELKSRDLALIVPPDKANQARTILGSLNHTVVSSPSSLV